MNTTKAREMLEHLYNGFGGPDYTGDGAVKATRMLHEVLDELDAANAKLERLAALEDDKGKKRVATGKRNAKIAELEKRPPYRTAQGEDICWHCRVVLVTETRPRCENCPDYGDCDVEGCEEDGCTEEHKPLLESKKPVY